ncbi:MAG TPA: AAA family ATPase, partial [Anaerolineales bacterium]|nr:AAA family ATPase [Anaerolineales bacterium]
MELIEREQQLKKLTDAWNQVRAGKGCIALVSGEAGIGKTSLIEYFVAGQREATRVLRGACDDMFSPQPLGPFLDIALQLQSDLLPLIQSGADRLTISTQFFIQLQKSTTPTVIVLEDLHWADEATLDVVKFLGRRIQLTKSLLILSYRDDEVSSKHPLHFLLGDFPPQFTARIPIPRLSENAVQLLAHQAGRQPGKLYTTTGGNPFFVSEVIAADTDGVPMSVRDAVLARVARLSPAGKNIVELAASMPGAAELWLIEEIVHPDPNTLDECIERGVLLSKGDSLAFRHELARQSVEGSLPIGRIRDLHAKILAVLLRKDSDSIPLARLVHHAVRAGDEAATLQYAPAAAWQASNLGAHREAASLYKTSLSLTRYLSAETRAEFFEDLSFENYLIDDLEEALQARLQATLIWEKLKQSVRAGDCMRWLSRLYWTLGNKKEAEKYADRAIEILLEQPAGPELAMAYSNKSQLHMLAWEEEPALEWGNRAMELAEKLGATEIFVHALTNVGSIESILTLELGHAKIERALQIARDKEMHDHVGRCYANLASNCVRSRLYSDGQRWLAEGLEYTTARDVDFYTIYLSGWQAQMYF